MADITAKSEQPKDYAQAQAQYEAQQAKSRVAVADTVQTGVGQAETVATPSGTTKSQPPNPQVDPKGYVEWVKSNPDADSAAKAQAAIIEKFNYQVPGINQPGQLTSLQVEQAFSPSMKEVAEIKASDTELAKLSDAQVQQRIGVERMDRAGVLGSAGYGRIPHEFQGVDVAGKPTTVKVDADTYWDITNLSPADRLPGLIQIGALPEGTQLISDVKAFNKQFGTNISPDAPYALPEMVEYVNKAVRIEGGGRVLARYMDTKTGNLSPDAFIVAQDNKAIMQALEDVGYIKDGKVSGTGMTVKEYAGAVQEQQKFIDENIKTDSYLRGILRSKGAGAAIDAYNKRQEDLASIRSRTQARSKKQLEQLRKNDPYMWGILTRDGEGVTDKSYQAYLDAMSKRETDIAGIRERSEERREKAVQEAIAGAITPPSEEESLEMAAMRYTPMDVTKAERSLNDKIAEIEQSDKYKNLSRKEKSKLIEDSDEYKHYLYMLDVAKTPGFETRIASDIAREALSFGAVQTPTYNRKDVEKQYYQQKEIALASFTGDQDKLDSLYKAGYFGEGDSGEMAYRDTLLEVKQQKAIKDAVNAGNLPKLRTLYDQGAFGDDLAAYTNLVNYVESGGRELAPITAEDIKAVDESFGTKEEYVKNVMDAMPTLGKLTKDVAIGLVPVWGTIYHWDKMGTGMRAVSIATDALSFIPVVGGVSAAAKTAAGVGRTARIAAGLKVVPKLVTAELMAPVTSMLHPVETAKALGSTAKSLVNVLNPRYIPGSTLSTVYSTVRLDTAILGDPVATKYVRDQLMALQAAGKKPVIQFGDKVLTLRSGTFLDEGGVVHASPNIRFTGEPEGFTVTTKVYPEGHPKAGQRMPAGEQGMFVANVALERFAVGGSAFGFEKGAASATENIKAITDAAEQARLLGDTSKADKLNKLVDDYNAAIASKNIKALDKAENKIVNQLTEIASDEIIARINTARATAGERFAIGDVKGAQEAMQEAASYEKQLEKARPGFAIFSPEVNEILVPSGKTYTGMVFQPKVGEFWSISVREMKSDKAAKLLNQAQDATRLGDKATAAKLTKEANDLIKDNKSGFRRVESAEMELKFPELTEMQQLKPRYTTAASDTGAKLWIYTTEPYSLRKALKAKIMAPVDTLRNIYEPAIKVRTIPMTRAKKLSRIDELLEQAKAADKAGDASRAELLRAEADVIRRSLTKVKGATKADDIASAVARAEKMDDADELLQAAKRADASGDYASADRLRRAADAIAGRRYVNAIARRAGTVSGLAEYARALSAMRLSERGIPAAKGFAPSREISPLERRPEQVMRDAARKTRLPDTRAVEPPPRVPEVRITELREPVVPSVGRATETAREVREPEVTRAPDATRPVEEPTERVTDTRLPREDGRETRTTLDTRRTPSVGRVLETPRMPRVPEVPRETRVPREPRVPRRTTRISDTTASKLQLQGVSVENGQARLPSNSVTWRQGMFWKWIPKSDFKDGVKPRTLPRGLTPIGAKFTDLRTPQETIQVIDDAGVPVPDFRVDLGKTDITITDQAKTIQYTGGGERTDVGNRIPNTTQGMTVESRVEPKGHAYARKVYPRHSVSRTADSKEMPERSAGELKGGKSRVEIAEDTEAMVKESKEYRPSTRFGYGALDELGGYGSFGDEDPNWLRRGPRSKRKEKKKKEKKIRPIRGRGVVPTVMRGVK